MDIFQIVRLNEKENYQSAIGSFDINSLNENNQNLLHEAITFGNVDIGIDLITKGININQKDKNGQTPLHYAALYNQVELTEDIIAAGGEVNICDLHGNNPLWTATFNARGKYELVKLLIKKGGNPHSKNNNNKSPLDFAEQINDENLINFLLNKQLKK